MQRIIKCWNKIICLYNIIIFYIFFYIITNLFLSHIFYKLLMNMNVIINEINETLTLSPIIKMHEYQNK